MDISDHERKKGFISGGAMVLMVMMMAVSMSVITGISMMTEREVFSGKDLKARCTFEKWVLMNTENSGVSCEKLPDGYDVASFDDGNGRIYYRLYYGDDMRDEFWVRKKE